MNAAIGTVRQGAQRRDAELFVDLILGLGADQRPTCGFILASFIDGARRKSDGHYFLPMFLRGEGCIVIPCAVQSEAALCRHEGRTKSGALYDPG